jgi:hypothetical protein
MENCYGVRIMLGYTVRTSLRATFLYIIGSNPETDFKITISVNTHMHQAVHMQS